MFSIKEAVKYGWHKVGDNFWKVIGLMLISAVPQLVISILDSAQKETGSTATSVLLSLLIIAVNVVSVFIGIGLAKILLRMHDGENPEVKEIFSAHGVFWRYLGASILYGLIVAGGLLLLVVPGIIWALKYQFAPLIVIDAKSGIRAALRESGRITEGSKWKLLGFGMLSILIVLAGYIVLLVGALVTVPIAAFAWIHVYRTLSQAKAAVSTQPPPSPQPAP